jgi:hypothetical protein
MPATVLVIGHNAEFNIGSHFGRTKRGARLHEAMAEYVDFQRALWRLLKPQGETWK